MRLAVLGSGSEGNAIYLEASGTRILLDAGFSCRDLEARLTGLGVDPARIDAILLSHEHGDHSRGAARYAGRFRTIVAGTRATLRSAGLRSDACRLLAFEPGEPFRMGSFRVATARVSHDAADPVGFRLEAGANRIGFALDLGRSTEAIRDLLAGCQTLILEANHDAEMLEQGPYPRELKTRLRGPHGHLSNHEAADLLGEVAGGSTRTVVLAHLSRTNNRPHLARAAALSVLRARGSAARLVVADPYPAGRWIES